MQNKYGFSKITLGTAQFGAKYGINSQGQPTEKEVFEILEYAYRNDIDAIDTSPNYGDSDKIIGKFLDRHLYFSWKVCLITKLEAQSFPDEIWKHKKILSQRVRQEIKSSCKNFNRERITVCIVHFADQAFKNNGILLDELTKLKNQGYIYFIGTSLYTADELERCIDDRRIEVVQLPFSILDRRLLESGLLRKAKERGLIIFARSVFLQGLVFMQQLPAELSNAKQTIDNLHRLTGVCDMIMSELCLRYVLSIKEISSIVIGVDNLEQLKENIRIASLGPLDKDVLKEIEKLPQMPADLIDIRSWGQRFDFTKNWRREK